jgi:hypothetical protein
VIVQLVIGMLAATVLLLLVNHARQRGLKVTWWGWLLTVLGILYAVFVLELIVAFLGEGSGQAAAVVGLILGVPAAIWGVLLGRFAFRSHREAPQAATAE